ncbi:hypothetical protein GQ600_11685 [Phytophthora cactorum]|nr:hypothetical protein GQ600_11685 [Phytophthora cactorum]
MARPDGAHFNLSANENSFKCGDEVLLLGQIEVEAVPGVDFDMFSSISLDDWDTGIGRHKHSKDEKLRAFSRQRNNPDTTEVLVIGELQCSVAEAAALLCCPGEADFNATMTRIHGHSFERGSVVRSFSSGKNENQDEDLLTPSDSRYRNDPFDLMRCPQRCAPPDEVRRNGSRILALQQDTHQLQSLQLGYLVEAISDRESAAVRVVFYGCSLKKMRAQMKISVLVCPHCLDTIQNCNHAHLVFSGRGSGSSASTSTHGSGGEIFRSARVQPDADDALEPGQAVVSYLADILSDEVEAFESEASINSIKATKAHTATNVLQELTSVLDEGINRVMAHCFWDSDNSRSHIRPESQHAGSIAQTTVSVFKRTTTRRGVRSL